MGLMGRTSFGAAAKIGRRPRRPLLGLGSGGGTIIGPIRVLMGRSVGITHKLCGGQQGELGVLGWFVLGGRGVFMTCNYDPPGNYIGERSY